jgi:hypothetical protein
MAPVSRVPLNNNNNNNQHNNNDNNNDNSDNEDDDCNKLCWGIHSTFELKKYRNMALSVQTVEYYRQATQETYKVKNIGLGSTEAPHRPSKGQKVTKIGKIGKISLKTGNIRLYVVMTPKM